MHAIRLARSEPAQHAGWMVYGQQNTFAIVLLSHIANPLTIHPMQDGGQ
jgi:predicted Abi (CAAX) family protease